MDMNEAMQQRLAQAREVQQRMAEAVNKAAEQMKPHIEESMRKATELQATLTKHVADSSEIAAEQSKTLLGHVNDFIRLGGEAMRASAEQTRVAAERMMEQSRKIVENAAGSGVSGGRSGPSDSEVGGG